MESLPTCREVTPPLRFTGQPRHKTFTALPPPGNRPALLSRRGAGSTPSAAAPSNRKQQDEGDVDERPQGS